MNIDMVDSKKKKSALTANKEEYIAEDVSMYSCTEPIDGIQ